MTIYSTGIIPSYYTMQALKGNGNAKGNGHNGKNHFGTPALDIISAKQKATAKTLDCFGKFLEKNSCAKASVINGLDSVFQLFASQGKLTYDNLADPFSKAVKKSANQHSFLEISLPTPKSGFFVTVVVDTTDSRNPKMPYVGPKEGLNQFYSDFNAKYLDRQKKRATIEEEYDKSPFSGIFDSLRAYREANSPNAKH